MPSTFQVNLQKQFENLKRSSTQQALLNPVTIQLQQLSNLVNADNKLIKSTKDKLEKLLPLNDVKYRSRLTNTEMAIEMLPVQIHLKNEPKSSENNTVDHHFHIYCDVVVVSYNSIEDYKNNVKPLLQQFVGEKQRSKEEYLIVYDCSASSSGSQSISSESDTVSTSSQTTTASNLMGRRFRMAMQGAAGGAADGGGNKELYRRLMSDFGSTSASTNSRTTMLPLSSLQEDQDGKSPASKDSSKHILMWDKFLLLLGQFIVLTFDRRCQLLDENLRQMLQRKRDKDPQWNFAEFFRLKQQLAVNLENLQMEKEALVQYEELRAFVSTESDIPSANSMRSLESYNESEFLSRLEQKEVTIQDLYRHLFEREVHFNFRLVRPVNVMQIAQSYILNTYKLCVEADTFSQEDVDTWAFGACWDLQCASQAFFCFDEGNGGATDLLEPDQIISCTRILCSMLEFGLDRLKAASICKNVCSDGFLQAIGKKKRKTLGNWVSWNSLETPSPQSDAERKMVECAHDNYFESSQSLEATYETVSNVLAAHYDRVGKHRSSTRMHLERAELSILREDFTAAASILEKILAESSDSSWDGIYCFILFRLACCQRRLKDPINYLPTLAKCFSPGFAVVTPIKAQNYLLSDLEDIVKGNHGSDVTFKLSPLLGLELKVAPTSTGKVTITHGNQRRRVTMYRCEVGEEVNVQCRLSSHLPRPITVDKLQLSIMTLEEFDIRSNANKAALSRVEDENSHMVVTIQGPVTVSPSSDTFEFKWTPMGAGLFVISQLSATWGTASFVHESFSFTRRPIPGFEIIHSTPTQNIKIAPLSFMLPGSVQEVTCTFQSGKDIVMSGDMEIKCSEGLKLLAPGGLPEEKENFLNLPWSQSIILPLESHRPDTETPFKIPVLAEEDSEGVDQEISVLAKSQFRHVLYPKFQKIEPTSEPMPSVKECVMRLRSCNAFKVNMCKAYRLDEDLVLIRLALRSNAPSSLIIKSWNVNFPQPLELLENGDPNSDLFPGYFSKGEEIFFGFQCRLLQNKTVDYENIPDAQITIVVEDSSGNIHKQNIILDGLHQFYKSLSKEETRKVDSKTATATLTCNKDQGYVGAPVHFTYDVDASRLLMDTFLMYSISCDERDWILNGKVGGLLKEKKTSLSFVAIPSRAGKLTYFPELKVHCDGALTKCQTPDVYFSLPHETSMTLAFPVLEDEE